MKKSIIGNWLAAITLCVVISAMSSCDGNKVKNDKTTDNSVTEQKVSKDNVQPIAEKEPTVKEEKVEKVEEVAIMETSVGTIVLRFFPDVAPGHVENFKKLSKEGFYDGTRFHRIIAGFMIQGGDPNSKEDDTSKWGTGSPGYSIKAEFNNKQHVKGTLSMARSADPNSAGSQFFICHGRAASLDGQYTAFGEVMDGMDVLDEIATSPVTSSPSGEKSLPMSPVTIKNVKITPLSEYKEKA